MKSYYVLLCYGLLCLCYTQCKILYQCNFDNSTLDDHCFTTPVLVLNGFALISEQPPDSPWSDVTSSLKATENGEVCQLPYKVGTYSWDLYFCYKNSCPTDSSLNSTCVLGKFAGIQLSGDTVQSFQLRTESDEIDGINEQYLTYYYYMAHMIGKKIQVRKVEAGDKSSVVDVVTSSPFNGWIKREVKFNVINRGYKLYFDLQKLSANTSFNDIGLDEISISQEDETTTEPPTTTGSPTTTEPPTTTESPTTTEPPTTTESAMTTKRPTTTESPMTTKPLTTTESPTATESLMTSKRPTITEPPMTTESPVTTVTSTIIDAATIASTTVETLTISSAITTEQSTTLIRTVQTSTTTVIPTTISDIETSISSVSSSIVITTPNTQLTTTSSTTTTSPSAPTTSTTSETTTTHPLVSSTTITDTSNPTHSTIITNFTSIIDTSSTTRSTTTSSNKMSTLSTIISINVTKLDDKNGVKPSSKIYIIILSTVLPVVLVISIGIIIKVHQSSPSCISPSKKRRLNNDNLELELVKDDHWF